MSYSINKQKLFSGLQEFIDNNSIDVELLSAVLPSLQDDDDDTTAAAILDAALEVLSEHGVEISGGEVNVVRLVEDTSDIARSEVSLYAQYLTEASQYPMLTKEEELTLMRQARDGNILARNKLVEHNLLLVVRYAHRVNGRGIPLIDLIQEGNMGLVYAADRVDPERGYRFSTYAGYWISRCIRAAIAEKSSLVRIPTNVLRQSRKLNQVWNDLEGKIGRKPTISELATESKMSEFAVKTLMSLPTCVLSLDCTASYNEGDSIISLIPDDTVSVEDRALQSIIANVFYRELQRLPKKEQMVIRRYCIKRETLKKIGDDLGVSRERVRQIRELALKHLKRNVLLRDLVEDLIAHAVKDDAKHECSQAG